MKIPETYNEFLNLSDATYDSLPFNNLTMEQAHNLVVFMDRFESECKIINESISYDRNKTYREILNGNYE